MLQMRDVILASFKILVNERAVDHAATTPLTKPPAVTWMGRPRTEYGDLPEDPVEHASRAFADRLKAKLDSLRSEKAYELMAIREWAKLEYYTKLISATAAATVPFSPFLAGLLADLNKLKDALLDFMFAHVTTCLSLPCPGGLENLIEAQRAHYCMREKQTPIEQLLARLNGHQKACLPFFWLNLKDSFPSLHNFRHHTFNHEHLTYIASTFNEHLQEALDKGYFNISLRDFNEQLNSNYSFDEMAFHALVEHHLTTLSVQLTSFRDSENNNSIPFFLSDHLLLALDESETKYLPLWAGGFDDGSGGVFQDEVPPTDMGPSEPGPDYHTGHTIASNADTDDSSSTVGYARTSTTLSDLGVGELELDDRTAARSNAAHGGSVSTALDSGVVSVASETFTAADDGSMRAAMFAVPAEHQGLGQVLAEYVEGFSDDADVETETEVGDEDMEAVDDDLMDSDSTLSLGGGSDDDDDDFEMVDPRSASE